MAVDKELEPILIAFVKQNKLQFSTNTFKEILSKVGSQPVSVVSISHPIDDQKNQILNETLKYLQTYNLDKNSEKDVFWKTKSNSDTKGIYLWPKPVIIKKSGQEVAVLLMETNGNFDQKSATHEDLLLLALNCVLSSTLIHSIGGELTDNEQQFFQLFAKYIIGGIDSELNESFLNLVLLIRDWSLMSKYRFGYHDTSTCPPSGGKLYNYKMDRLAIDKDDIQTNAFRNKYFLESFQKISCCLMPCNESEFIDHNINVQTFGEIVKQIIGRLFHPSNIGIKRFGIHKLNGHQLVKLFQQISALFAETKTQNIEEKEFDFNCVVNNVIALSNGINFYKFQMNKLIDDNKYFSEQELTLLHKESKDRAIDLFESIKGVEDEEQNGHKKDKFYELFDGEVEKVWKLFEGLNQLKFETLKIKPRPQRLVDEMIERVVKKKKEFDSSQNALDLEISELIGLNLTELTHSVRSAVGAIQTRGETK